MYGVLEVVLFLYLLLLWVSNKKKSWSMIVILFLLYSLFYAVIAIQLIVIWWDVTFLLLYCCCIIRISSAVVGIRIVYFCCCNNHKDQVQTQHSRSVDILRIPIPKLIPEGISPKLGGHRRLLRHLSYVTFCGDVHNYFLVRTSIYHWKLLPTCIQYRSVSLVIH